MILKSGSCLSLRPLSPFRLSLLVYSPAPFWVEYRVKMFRVKFTIPTGIFLCVKWSLKTGFAYKFWRFRWTKECVGEDFVFFADRAAGSGRSKEVEGGGGGVFVCPLANRPARLVQHPARVRMDGAATEQVSPAKEGEGIHRPSGLLEGAVGGEGSWDGSCRQIYPHVFMTGHQTCSPLPLPVPSRPVSCPGAIRSGLSSTDLERAGAAQRRAGRPVLRADSDQLVWSEGRGRLPARFVQNDQVQRVVGQ